MKREAKSHLLNLLSRYPLLECIREKITEAFLALEKCYQSGGKLLICGNGGSAADADHIVGELMKGFKLQRPLDPGLAELLGEHAPYLQKALPAISLSQHVALTTAFGNDLSFNYGFAQQVLGYGKEKDTLLCISTSGNSKNVLFAAQVAKKVGMTVIGMTGKDGGQLAAVCDVLLNVPQTTTEFIQELHMPVYHALCAMLETEFFGGTE